MPLMSSENNQLEQNIQFDPLPSSDKWEDGVVEQINKKDIKPINDVNCKHRFVEDKGDQTEYYIAMKCVYCPIGYLKPKKNT